MNKLEKIKLPTNNWDSPFVWVLIKVQICLIGLLFFKKKLKLELERKDLMKLKINEWNIGQTDFELQILLTNKVI